MRVKKIKTTTEIGKRVKKRRRELGISQERLAEIMDVTYQQVQRYENGMNRLNVENIQIIADALSVPVSYFFKDAGINIIAENSSLYLADDESKLLRYFRKTKKNSSKSTVLQVARLAAKG